MRQRIEAVSDGGTALGIRTGDNPTRWRRHLDRLLPKPKTVTAVKHHPAFAHADIAVFMADLSNSAGVAARVPAFTFLTAARSGETRGATWAGIDLDAKP